MNTRLMVTLDAEQHRRAKQAAAARGISLAEYVRQAIAGQLDDGAAVAVGDRDAVIGLFDSGGADIAERKDAHVGDAVSRRHHERAGR